MEDQNRRLNIDLVATRQRGEDLEKELNKFQNLAKLNPLSFAKNLANQRQAKNREVEQLAAENEALQRQIDQQENAFKRSNETYMGEIARLEDHTRKLELEVKQLQNGYSEASQPECDLGDLGATRDCSPPNFDHGAYFADGSAQLLSNIVTPF